MPDADAEARQGRPSTPRGVAGHSSSRSGPASEPRRARPPVPARPLVAQCVRWAGARCVCSRKLSFLIILGRPLSSSARWAGRRHGGGRRASTSSRFGHFSTSGRPSAPSSRAGPASAASRQGSLEQLFEASLSRPPDADAETQQGRRCRDGRGGAVVVVLSGVHRARREAQARPSGAGAGGPARGCRGRQGLGRQAPRVW